MRPLVEARQEEGPFKSVEDMCRRANLHNLNKRALESLIKVGALDSLEDRGSLLGGIDRILSMSPEGIGLKELRPIDHVRPMGRVGRNPPPRA